MLKEEGPKEWIFKECQKLAEMTFRFKDREKPQMYTCSLASRLFVSNTVYYFNSFLLFIILICSRLIILINAYVIIEIM